VAELVASRYEGVLSDARDFFTPNLVPGRDVYGEKLLMSQGREFRRWDPFRSKLAALMHKGCPAWPFKPDSTVLYLGAASGTTCSHISDICSRGRLCCVEISPRVFQKLLDVCSARPNMNPFLGDASRPETYRNLFGAVDVVYQDIAQRDQLPIFLKNLPLMKPDGTAFLMVKARSVDVSASPRDVYTETAKGLGAAGYRVLGSVELNPFEKDHAAIMVRRASGQA